MDSLRRTYRAWWNAKDRCTNPKNKSYKDYGERGITFSSEWQSFEKFFVDMGLCPDDMVLDRIDNNGNYERGNCRWTDWLTSGQNRRQNGGRKRGESCLAPVMIEAWRCTECGHVCRSKRKPRRCTNPDCAKVDKPKRPGRPPNAGPAQDRLLRQA